MDGNDGIIVEGKELGAETCIVLGIYGGIGCQGILEAAEVGNV